MAPGSDILAPRIHRSLFGDNVGDHFLHALLLVSVDIRVDERPNAPPRLQRRAAAIVDIDADMEGGAERQRVRPVEALHQGNPHRDALHDLDPVAGRILWRQKGEDRSGPRADALHHT